MQMHHLRGYMNRREAKLVMKKCGSPTANLTGTRLEGAWLIMTLSTDSPHVETCIGVFLLLCIVAAGDVSAMQSQSSLAIAPTMATPSQVSASDERLSQALLRACDATDDRFVCHALDVLARSARHVQRVGICPSFRPRRLLPDGRDLMLAVNGGHVSGSDMNNCPRSSMISMMVKPSCEDNTRLWVWCSAPLMDRRSLQS